ncbi:hypothetical protein EDB19DRAFT_1271823 [Suillus lakei]|nr:hypothetical protein EDB19DRAFT_1271823 [Suillus lakei]
MSLDWFGRKTSVYGPSYSSGVLSLCVSNLPRALRYRAENLLVCFMTPGPKEPTGSQLQNYMRLVVDDLLQLYDEGIIYHTPAYPQGRRVRVVLLGVVCDHPAMCKLSGFADHSHNNAPCSKCHVSQDDLFSDESLRNEFAACDGEAHRQRCYEDNELLDNDAHTTFFKEHGARWTELARLPYFDLVRQTIIDPMHNLLLGIVKTQWYNRWIQNSALRASTDARARELDMIHKFLASFEAPLWAGKLPLRVGEPAGGSLTADEYKFAALTAWPIIIPIVWQTFINESDKDFESAQKRHLKAQEKFNKDFMAWKSRQELPQGSANMGKRGNRSKEDAEPKPPKQPNVRMQRDEPTNLLRLSTALKIFCGSSVQLELLPRAEVLLQEYLLEFKWMYGEGSMKPNFHWAVHLAQQIKDYGPVYNFWAFLSERLNKVLKSSNSNNWTGGQVEISMMREFMRAAQIDSMVSGFTC